MTPSVLATRGLGTRVRAASTRRMKSSLLALAALSFAFPAAAQSSGTREAAPRTPAEHAADAAKNDTLAWDFVDGITTEIGPRQPGTEAEARARAWAIRWL